MEECFLITNNEELLKCIIRLEYLNNIRQFVKIRLIIAKEMFDESLKSIFSKISFDNNAIVNSIEVIRNDYVIYENDNFALDEELTSNSIIKFKIPREMTLKVHKNLIVLNDVEGRIILMNEDSSFTCYKTCGAIISNIKSSSKPLFENRVHIRGDQLI